MRKEKKQIWEKGREEMERDYIKKEEKIRRRRRRRQRRREEGLREVNKTLREDRPPIVSVFPGLLFPKSEIV
jgi:hypothetical protein